MVFILDKRVSIKRRRKMETRNVYKYELLLYNKKKLTKKQIDKVAEYIDTVMSENFYERLPKIIEDSRICIEWEGEQ
jgi:hypothetical protein